jgi:hypothetical protein
MPPIRTVVCKLAPTAEQTSAIDATLRAFAAACDFAAAARRIGSTNKLKIQQVCYAEIRRRFGLSANLAIRAIARACAALKDPRRRHGTFAPASIDYDARIFAFHQGNWTFGLTLQSGRVKLATVLGQRCREVHRRGGGASNGAWTRGSIELARKLRGFSPRGSSLSEIPDEGPVFRED